MTAVVRIGAVARLELTRLFRTRATLSLLFMVPALQLLLFGYAIRPAGAPIRVALAAADGAGAQLLPRLRELPDVVVPDGPALPAGGAERAVRAGRALVGIEVPPQRGPLNPLAPIRPVRVVIDGTDPAAAALAERSVRSLYWQREAERAEAKGPGLAIETLYNPARRADWSFLPGLAGVVPMIAMVMLGALTLAREREQGTWEALLALPVSPGEALAGKLLPYAAIGTLQGAVVLALSAALFQLPIRGALWALALLLPLFAAAHLALGAVVAGRARTQLDALQGAVAFYLLSMLLSGFLYQFDTLPRWAQMVGALFPLTHFIRAARGATLTGASAATVLAEAVPIALFFVVAVVVAALAQPRRLS
jgi:ABC-2 type transport system permease protein